MFCWRIHFEINRETGPLRTPTRARRLTCPRECAICSSAIVLPEGRPTRRDGKIALYVGLLIQKYE